MFSMTESDLRNIFGDNLKRYRTLKGFSQEKLAEILDLSPNFISDMETGKRWLSSDTLVNLAEALDVEVHELLKLPQTPTDDISAFIQAYTKKAAAAASEAVTRSLTDLRRYYTEENLTK
jgi:transcriptional regulator with XRE-family HTH domain